MSAGVALYYPHIEFRNPAWLKWALLFWDNGIRRIVPSGYEPHDSSEVKLVVQENLITDTDSDIYRKDASAEFKSHLGAYRALAVEATYSSLPDSPTVNSYINTVGAMQLDKVDPELAEMLVDTGLAVVRAGRRDNLAAQQPLVALYMTILAQRMSKSIEAPIITDRPYYAAMAREIIGGMPSNMDSADTSNVLQTLLLPFVHPESVDRLSMEQILEIRRKHLPSLRRFREEMEDTIVNLTEVSDPNAYHDKLHDAQLRVEREVNDLKAQLLADRIDFVDRALGVSGLSSIASITTAAGGELLPSIAFGSIGAAFLLKALIYWQKKQALTTSSSFQYVLSLGHEVGG